MINQGRSVPLLFRLVGTIVASAIIIRALGTLPEGIAILAALALSSLIPMLWFSFNILTIDNTSKELHSGVWLMGFKTGKRRKFDHIEKIYINQVRTSQAMYSQSNRKHTSRGVEYHAYLKLTNGEKHFLLSHKSERELTSKVKELRKKLDLSDE